MSNFIENEIGNCIKNMISIAYNFLYFYESYKCQTAYKQFENISKTI